MIPSLFRITLIAAALTLGAAAALAQDGPPPNPPPGYQGAAGAPPASSSNAQADQLRQTLKLRPEQEADLQAYVAAMTPPPGMAARMRAERSRNAGLPTPQRLDGMLAQMDEMRADLVRRIAATKHFYAQLSPDQQQAFDANHMDQPQQQRPGGY